MASESVEQSLQGEASVLRDLATVHFIAKFGCQKAKAILGVCPNKPDLQRSLF